MGKHRVLWLVATTVLVLLSFLAGQWSARGPSSEREPLSVQVNTLDRPVLDINAFGEAIEGVSIALDCQFSPIEPILTSTILGESAAPGQESEKADSGPGQQAAVAFYTYVWNQGPRPVTVCKFPLDYRMRVWDAEGREVTDYKGWTDLFELVRAVRSDWVTLGEDEMVRVLTRARHPDFAHLESLPAGMRFGRGEYTAQVTIRTDLWWLHEHDMAPGDKSLGIWRPAVGKVQSKKISFVVK